MDKMGFFNQFSIILFTFKDDLVVPYMLGERLYQAALAKRPLDAKPVNFVSFESELGLAHIFIYSAPETPSIIGRSNL